MTTRRAQVLDALQQHFQERGLSAQILSHLLLSDDGLHLATLTEKLVALLPVPPTREQVEQLVVQYANTPHVFGSFDYTNGREGRFTPNKLFIDWLLALWSPTPREEKNVDTCKHMVYTLGWNYCPSCGLAKEELTHGPKHYTS